MTLPFWLELAWKSAAIAGVVLGVLRLLRGRSAAERSAVAHLGLLAVLLLPAGAASLPPLRLTAAAAVAQVLDVAPASVAAEPSGAGPAPAAPIPTAARADRIVSWLYWGPALGLLLLLAVSLLRLGRLRRRASFPADPRWATALASAQARLGFKHGAVLLVSDEVTAPISWGLLRPTILLSASAGADVARADAVVAHEIAHIAHLDWLKLLAARLVTALFWFNPLVWLLARRCHELCEEAADDAVLRARVNRTDYADLLVDTARRSTGPRLLAVHGVAPGRSALGRRVSNLLDAQRRRVPAGGGWKLGSAMLALAIAVPVAAIDLVRAPMTVAGFSPEAGNRAAAELAALDHPVARALARALRHRNWAARRAEGVTTFHLPAATAPLLAAMADADPVVRRIAVWGLSEMRPAPIATAQTLGAHLSDPDPGVRGEAARALGDFGAATFAPEIARLLADPNAFVVRQAAHALGDLRRPETRAPLQAVADHPDLVTRARVRWALGQVPEAGSRLPPAALD